MSWSAVHFYFREFFWCLRVFPSALKRVHGFVVLLQPWGILLAAVGLVVALAGFWFDYEERVHERTVRAWQLLTAPAQGNSGKVAALEYLNRQDGLWCGNAECALPLKERSTLSGIDLSATTRRTGNHLDFVDLGRASLPGAKLRSAFLRFSNFRGANLTEADLSQALLVYADFGSASLSGASLRGAIMYNANLKDAELAFADLSSARLAAPAGALSFDQLAKGATSSQLIRGHGLDASPIALVVSGPNGAPEFAIPNFGPAAGLRQSQLDKACGNEMTLLPEGLTIPMCSEVDWFERNHGDR